MINIVTQLEIILLLCSFIYTGIKIYKMHKKIKKGYKEKYIIPKIICYNLFYEIFFIHDIIKYGMKRTNENLLDVSK